MVVEFVEKFLRVDLSSGRSRTIRYLRRRWRTTRSKDTIQKTGTQVIPDIFGARAIAILTGPITGTPVRLSFLPIAGRG